MELSVISDTLTTISSTQGFGLGQGISKFLLNRHQSSFSSNAPSDQCGGTLQISAGIFPIDAVAPQPVQSKVKTLPRKITRKRRRTRRKTFAGDDGDDDGEEMLLVFFGDGGDGGGPSDNNWGGGDGKGGNFGGSGGSDWGDSSSNNDPAFDFVYEVLSWIVFSNCLHFAFKKVVRIVANGLGDPARQKVPIRLAPVC